MAIHKTEVIRLNPDFGVTFTATGLVLVLGDVRLQKAIGTLKVLEVFLAGSVLPAV